MTSTQRVQIIDMINEVGLAAFLDVAADAFDVEADMIADADRPETWPVAQRLETFGTVTRSMIKMYQNTSI